MGRMRSLLIPGVDKKLFVKDAVKLSSRWPRQAPPLWYVSQRLLVERGVGGLERLLDDLRTPAEPIQTF